MAIKLSSKPNTIGPGGAYEYGDIRDRDGLTPGTPGSREVYADFHQFFERLMDLGGVEHNDLPDNTANGFQLMNALRRYILGDKVTFILKVNFEGGKSNPTVLRHYGIGAGFVSMTHQGTLPGRYLITASNPFISLFGFDINDCQISFTQLTVKADGGIAVWRVIKPHSIQSPDIFSIQANEESEGGGGGVDLDEDGVILRIEFFKNKNVLINP